MGVGGRGERDMAGGGGRRGGMCLLGRWRGRERKEEEEKEKEKGRGRGRRRGVGMVRGGGRRTSVGIGTGTTPRGDAIENGIGTTTVTVTGTETVGGESTTRDRRDASGTETDAGIVQATGPVVIVEIINAFRHFSF